MRGKILWLLTLAALVFLPQSATPVSNIPAFEITGGGTLYHFEDIFIAPGAKPGVTKLSLTQIANCIQGNLLNDPHAVNCNATNLEIDAGGKAYIFLEGIHKIWIATNNTCANATELDGLVQGDGSFMFAGNHAKADDTNFIVQGKISFVSGTFSPTGIKKASVMAVSTPLRHYAIGTFATVAGSAFSVAPGSCGP
jgi:hypothetical protein